MENTKPNLTRQPWGFSAGLLAGCAATLVGVAVNHDPVIILTRAALSGCVVGMIVTCLTSGWRLLAPREEED